MIRHFFLDKCNTIFKDKNVNIGLNPVAELNYGKDVSRILLHFDESELKSLVEDKTYPDVNKINAVLKMTNCGNINGLPYDKTLTNSNCSIKERASSFTVLALELPEPFDEGRGFEHNGEV